MNKEKGFSLAELILAVALTGLLLIVICGVFIFGLNAIEKSKIRSTALNLADKKIAETKNLIMTLDDYDRITGDRLISIISDSNEIKVGGQIITADEEYEITWGLTGNELTATGEISIAGTTDYNYQYELKDDQLNLKKVRVEVTWEEERVGPQKVVLESLVSMLH